MENYWLDSRAQQAQVETIRRALSARAAEIHV